MTKLVTKAGDTIKKSSGKTNPNYPYATNNQVWHLTRNGYTLEVARSMTSRRAYSILASMTQKAA